MNIYMNIYIYYIYMGTVLRSNQACIYIHIWIYILGWPTFGTFSNMHGPKVPTVDPPLGNSSQPKKFVIK